MKSKIIGQDIELIIKEFEPILYKLEGKKFLITGGNGFIPSYIIDVLTTFNKKLKNPCKLIILNRHEINENSRLSHLVDDLNVKFIAQDVGKPFEINEKIDIIIHAASRANPTSFLENPLDTIDANINGLRTLLDYAKDNQVENFLFFSSGEIYGNPPKEFIPTPETYPGNVDCTSRRACYSESKRFGETLCMTFFRKYNVPIKILRIFHAYGPGLRDDGKAITDFFNSARKNKSITLRDRGESRIAFCYISDLIRQILLVMFEGKPGEVYNLGDDTLDVSIKELAEMIGNTIGNIPVQITETGEYRDGFKIDIRKPDISKLRALGFKPEINLEQGLRKMNDSYNEIGK